MLVLLKIFIFVVINGVYDMSNKFKVFNKL